MSEEKKENGSAPENKAANAKPDAPQAKQPAPASAQRPAAAAKAEAAQEEEPAPPPPGEYGKRLQSAGITFTPLGEDAGGMEMIDVPADSLLKAAEYLRDECGFDLLLSCSGVDWKTRLESVYHVYNTKAHQFLAIKVTAVDEHSPSVMPVWPAADWHERETYDLFGIQYDGHPNLSRILMPSDWLGHPLRKDYKVDDPRLVWNER